MTTWNNALESDVFLKEALSMLYGHNENMLHFLLNQDQPCLISSSENIKNQANVFSTGEQLLIRIGLDIWDGSGGIHFNELYQGLDERNFQKMLLVLLFLRSPQKAILF